MRQHDERDLRTALREEADRHRPDRAAMLTRIAQGRAAPARRPADRVFALLRPAAAALAVAVVLVLAVAGVRWGNRAPEADDAPVAAPSVVAATTPAPATTSPPEPTAPTTAATPSKGPRTSTEASTPARTTPPTTAPDADRDGFLASAGEIDPNTKDGWWQHNVVLETTRTIDALDVIVEVALTPGVAEAGRWSTVPTNLLTVTTSRTTKKLIFRFTLQQGATLAPGEYTFAAQFTHTPGKRSAAEDSYAAKVAGDGKDAKVSGGFTPRQ